MMQSSAAAPFRNYLPSIFSLSLFGWGLAAVAIFFLAPTLWARWMLFFGCILGLTGLAMPVTWFLNLRFPSDPPAGPYVPFRQALWAGVYGAILIWLQQARMVSTWIALGLAAGLIAVEYLVSMRERARARVNPPEVTSTEGEIAQDEVPPIEE
jgi:hypothetical protein